MVELVQKFAQVMEWIFGANFDFLDYVGTVKHLGKMMLPNGQYWS